jgi:hypothetical protein
VTDWALMFIIFGAWAGLYIWLERTGRL